MARERLSEKATYVTRGYGQVEPNHLSAEMTGQIYAQLPAAADIEVLENGQFMTYNYKEGVADFSGAGEWMLVFNEVKVYRDYEGDADFAMLKPNYIARVYSPIDGTKELSKWQSRFYGELDSEGNPNAERVATPADPYDPFSTDDPFKYDLDYKEPALMPEGTVMTPRLFKTNIGDIFTTNTIAAEVGSLSLGDTLTPGADGYLAPGTGADELHPTFEVVKIYTMPDMQPGVKIMRIK